MFVGEENEKAIMPPDSLMDIFLFVNIIFRIFAS